MLALVIVGNTVYLRGDNKEVAIAEVKIEPSMKFQPQGYEYSEKYKAGEWDGWISLFGRFTHSFPRGFLPDVETILQIEEIEYQIRDDSEPGKYLPFTAAPPTLQLRPYQEETVDKAIAERRGIICLPTGTGKTFCAAEIIRRLGLSTIVFVHKKELMEQWITELAGIYGVPRETIGRVGDGELNFKPITIAMLQTATRLPPQVFTDFGVSIFDEAHHVAAETVFEIAVQSKSAYFFGLSATPYRVDGKDLMLKGGLGDFIVNHKLSDMIEAGWLARPTVYIYPIPPETFPRHAKFAEVYRDYIVDNSDRNFRIREIAEFYRKEGLSVYIHVKHIRHGELLHELLPESMWIKGTDRTDVRQEAIKIFGRQGGILISTLLGEGVDMPGMDVLILACGGQSEVFVRQLIGRVLRITATKKHVVIIDFKDCCKYLAEHAENREAIYFSEEAFKVVTK